MMLIGDDDVIAIHRENTAGGHAVAMAELRRRFPGLSDRNAEKVLYVVLGRPAEAPPPYRPGTARKVTKAER